jgi:twitching motility protein PilI
MVSPFDLLVEIEKKSLISVNKLPQKADKAAYWRGIGFELAGQKFVAPMGEIVEVLHPLKVTKIPWVRKFVLGVSNIRGRLVPIIDLTVLLSTSLNISEKTSRILVVGQGDQQNGLLVDAVLGIQQFPSLLIDTSNPVENSSSFIRGCFEKDGIKWSIFSFADLIRSDEFCQIID